ncbi:hypothetical protein [Streptomyces sp. NPDC088725]|uniref:hypothetical protein n=1 Tax=Streptomyces sp. NPDC088725 TaxID=3365873 RepID=UPI00382395B4
MRVICRAVAALLGAGALALTASTASAAPAAPQGDITPFGFSITPSTVAAGGRVTLALTDCDTGATVTSAVFDTVTVPPGGTATATVDRDAKPGAQYRVRFSCGGESGTTALTIAGGSPAPRPRPTPTPAPTRTVAPTRVPPLTPVTTARSSPLATGGVRGGLGGSVGGIDTGEIVGGTMLVVAAATGAVHVARRRADGRGH